MVVTRAKNRRWEELEKDSFELSVLAKHFELYNKTEWKNPKTIDWYNLALRQFHRFLIESEKSTMLGELGEAEVRQFILYLQERKRVTADCLKGIDLLELLTKFRKRDMVKTRSLKIRLRG